MKKIKSIWAFFVRYPFVFCLAVSPLMNLFIESLGRRSLISGISHIFTNPVVFIYNSLIILATLSIAMLFKRKFFFFTLILTGWMTLGIINGVLRSFRATPLSAIDFFIVKAGFGFFFTYFTWWQIVLIVVAVVAIVALIVLLWKKGPRPEIKKMTSAVIIVASMLTLGAATVVGLESEIISNDFKNLEEAYEDYGFVFCFSCSLLDTGVSKPEDYSKESVEAILDKLDDDKSEDAEIKPDILMIQLESFFDPTYIRGLELSEYCMPKFRELTEKYPSGHLSVQYIGGGTANTEFEVLTGMNLEHFGPGEYPYMTVLLDSVCESLPGNLRGLGYTSHAFHNYTGVFYDRHNVYPNLGFDTFTSMEYMNIPEFNPMDWAKDIYLIDEIKYALDNSSGNNFIWAISVQPHGAYPKEFVECKYDIEVSGIPEDQIASTRYFVNQVKEVDDFVGELIATLESYDRPIVAVIYGDHLPPLEVNETDLEGISIYQTEYVIWSNYELENTDRDLEAYQLSAHLLDMIGYNCGTLTKLNQLGDDNKNYQNDLMMLEYDMLYGENYATDGDPVYAPAEMKMGIRDIKITDLVFEDGIWYVKGENFTEASKVKIDGWRKKTTFIDPSTLALDNYEIREGDEVSVIQVSDSGVTLGESNTIIKEES